MFSWCSQAPNWKGGYYIHGALLPDSRVFADIVYLPVAASSCPRES